LDVTDQNRQTDFLAREGTVIHDITTTALPIRCQAPTH
jgi:hypothetical protein